MIDVVLLADNDESRAKGLMHHRPLLKTECAYFYFKKEGAHRFWNANVSFPISLIFCDKNGIVEDIKYLDKHQLAGIEPKSKNIIHVVEAHVDAPNIYNIKIGSKLDVINGKICFSH